MDQELENLGRTEAALETRPLCQHLLFCLSVPFSSLLTQSLLLHLAYGRPIMTAGSLNWWQLLHKCWPVFKAGWLSLCVLEI